jgi:hypothetical protein
MGRAGTRVRRMGSQPASEVFQTPLKGSNANDDSWPVLGAVLWSGSALAYDPYDPNNCIGAGWDDAHPMVVAKVTARPRVSFVKSPYDDDFKAEGCPAATEACRKQSYLVTGDIVLVGNTRGEFSCISYQAPLAKKPNWTSGWLPSAALTRVAPMPASKASDWIGAWGPNARITIRNGGGGKLRIEAVRVIEMPSGNTHNGTFRVLVKPESSTLTFTDEGSYGEGCRVRMQRIGSWLLVEDNGGCGGSGVSFLGLYHRKK